MAYDSCYNITGSPVCGKNVTGSMHGAYYNCQNLTGAPVCGNNVTNFSFTYAYCYNITGQPVCGNKVTDMCETYFGCANLTGSPICGNNVVNFSTTYYGCSNLTGVAVCGNKVTDMEFAYYRCPNISGNAYMYSTQVVNARHCFSQKNNARRLNIYVKSGSKTNTVFHYTNSYSLVGSTITWTNAGTYQYNTIYNIYIYPVANVEAARIANGD
jgi:hypothetical protein